MSFGCTPSSSGSAAANEEEDEVIATFDVFHATGLEGNLHVLQYPLRSMERPYESMSTRLFVTEGLNYVVESASGDPSGAASTALGHPSSAASSLSPFGTSTNVSGDGQVQWTSRMTMHCTLDSYRSPSFTSPENDVVKDPDAIEEGREFGGHCYRYVLQSTPVNPRSDYAVGIFSNGQLHLTSVSTVQQFTPVVRKATAKEFYSLPISAMRVEDACLSHASDSSTASSAAGLRSQKMQLSTSSADLYSAGFSMNLAAVKAMPDRTRREMMRQRSVMLNLDADGAKELDFFASTSIECATVRHQMKSVSVASAIPTGASLTSTARSSVRATDVENALFPPEQALASNALPLSAAAAAGPMSMLRRYAAQHSVAEQLSSLLSRCQIATVEMLCRSVKLPQGDVSIRLLMPALHTHAVWLHGVWIAKHVHAFKGGSSAAIREFVLLKFMESPDATVTRAALNVFFPSHRYRAIVKDVLQSVAALNKDADPTQRRWKLRYTPEDIAALRATEETFKTTCPQDYTFQQTTWSRRAPYIKANAELLAAGKPVRALTLVVTVQDRQQQQFAVGKQREGASTAATGSTGAGAPKGADDHDLVLVRDFVRSLFLDHGVINKQRAKEMVLGARERHYRGATNSTLSAAMQGSVQQFTNATWVLKSIGDPEIDKYRPFLMRAALELNVFEAQPLVARTVEILDNENAWPFKKEEEVEEGAAPSKRIPDRVVVRVLNEIATHKEGERLWHLKSGNI